MIHDVFSVEDVLPDGHVSHSPKFPYLNLPSGQLTHESAFGPFLPAGQNLQYGLNGLSSNPSGQSS